MARLLARAWNGLLLGLMAFFVVNIGLMVASVATNSVATRWLGTWLPEGYTTRWYLSAWKEFQLADILIVTGGDRPGTSGADAKYAPSRESCQ